MRTVSRRQFGQLLFLGLASSPGCVDRTRYSEEDAAGLDAQREAERIASGKGPFGVQRYDGYRGLAELPWFEVDGRGRLRLVDDTVPRAIDLHAHLGMSLLFAPDIDLQARTERVEHLLDCDGSDPGCDLDLDVYINSNFGADDLSALRYDAVARLLWGSAASETQTLPNLVAEMDDVGVEKAAILPIAFGLPFGDDLADRWLDAIDASGSQERFIRGASVHLGDDEWREKLRRQAARGARMVKLHPAGQRYFPDDPKAMEIYEECGRLGLVVFLHGGRAGIEPGYAHQFTMMRGYEPMLAEHPNVNFVLGHAGARDVEDAMVLGRRYPNAWLGIHGQGVTVLDRLTREVGPDRLLFGTDWPFYHLGATLAKVLIITEKRPEVRHAILRGNAERLLFSA
ncbi:MAG: amidohydrolase family protein [Candidatus Binatia bacterium]|nr:amidohydrolase family protein [Candidatus Binatia bacterium]